MKDLAPNRLEPIRFSISRLVILVMTAIFLVETSYALLFVIYLNINPPPVYDRVFTLSLWAVHTLKFIALTYVIALVLIKNLADNLIISGHHLIRTSGFIARREKVYELGQIRSIYVSQGWLARILHFGTLRIVFGASGYTETLNLVGVHQPRYYEQFFRVYLDENSAPKTSAKAQD